MLLCKPISGLAMKKAIFAFAGQREARSPASSRGPESLSGLRTRTAHKTFGGYKMRKKLSSFLIILSLFALLLPAAALGQDRESGRFFRRDKNGYRVGDGRFARLDGPGILNHEYKDRWMEGPAGAATVIGIGAGAGAVGGGVVKGKKGAIIGAAVGAGAATGLWLYKNRTEKRRIF